MATDIVKGPGSRQGAARLSLRVSPLLALAAVLAVLPLLLLRPATLPAGSMYWDLFIYFDGANRIFDGQLPAVDFFAPAGPLSYWLFAGALKLFPEGQPLLLVQWSLLAVTAPLMALVLLDVDRRSRLAAFALLVPFLFFSLLPFNVEEVHAFPGADGYGIYNRQGSELLYVLGCALLFMQRRRLMLPVVAGAMLALFLVKITGFVAGGMICAFAFAAGRITFSRAVAVLGAFLVGLAALELPTGLVSSYLLDIQALVAMNSDSLLPRFLQAASLHFRTVAPALGLMLALLVLDARAILATAGRLVRAPSLDGVRDLFDRDVAWLAAFFVAGLFFETQNTGGQSFLLLWPVAVRILVSANRLRGPAFAVVLALVAAMALANVTQIMHRAARALVVQLKYETLDLPALKTLGRVSQRDEVIARAVAMNDIYRRHQDTLRDLANENLLPSFMLYAEPDFQIGWLMAVDEGVKAVLAYEAAHGVRFDTMMTLNFVNAFPYLLDRHATKYIAIGADPYRAVPAPDDRVLAAVRATDLILYPKCPITNANDKLLDVYRPGLDGHRLVTLSPCWDAYVRNDLVGN